MNLKTNPTRWLTLDAKTSAKYTADQAKSDITKLFEQAQSISKELTQWDFYRISSVVTSSDSFESIIASLLPNTATIINTDSFIYNINGEDRTLTRGDIVYKDNEFNITLIKAERGGNFYPSKLEQEDGTNNLKLTYTFTNIQPTEDEGAVTQSDNTWTVTKLGKNLDFENISTSNTSSIYGIIITKSINPLTNSFNVCVADGAIIRPVIKMFDVDNEEVYTDYELELNQAEEIKESTYTLTVDSTVVTKIIIK